MELKSSIYYPLLVSNDGTDKPLSKEEDTLIWGKYLKLSQENRDIITSYELPRKVKELQDKYNFNEIVVGQISLCIRKIFFGELTVAVCESTLSTLLSQSGGNPSQAKEILQFIDKEILHLVPKIPLDGLSSKETTETKQVAIEKLSLLKAMAKHERLGEQLLTNEKIKVKSQPEPVRPSLANWIRYYRDELGIGFHDQVLRGKFLFQSENGKRLGNEERERINLVLKSIEEDFPLEIDTEHQTIVFPSRVVAPVQNPQTTPRSMFPPREGMVPARAVKPFQSTTPQGLPVTAATPLPATATPSKPSFFANKFSPAKNVAGETLHFSTGHVLPGEKNQVPQEPQSAPASQSAPSTPSPMPLSPKTGFQSSSITQNRGAVLPRSPYSIRPLRLRNDVTDNEQGQE